MKKLDLNFNLKDLDGGEIAEAKVSKLLAGLLMSQKEGDAVKFFDWAVTLHKTGTIEVDSSDFETIKKITNESKDYLTMISKAQLLKYYLTL